MKLSNNDLKNSIKRYVRKILNEAGSPVPDPTTGRTVGLKNGATGKTEYYTQQEANQILAGGNSTDAFAALGDDESTPAASAPTAPTPTASAPTPAASAPTAPTPTASAPTPTASAPTPAASAPELSQISRDLNALPDAPSTTVAAKSSTKDSKMPGRVNITPTQTTQAGPGPGGKYSMQDMYTKSIGSYNIKKGDTLSALAKQWGTTLKSIAAANPNITNLDAVRVGSKINVPGNAKKWLTGKMTGGPPIMGAQRGGVAGKNNLQNRALDLVNQANQFNLDTRLREGKVIFKKSYIEQVIKEELQKELKKKIYKQKKIN